MQSGSHTTCPFERVATYVGPLSSLYLKAQP